MIRDEKTPPATCKITVLKKTLQDEFVELSSSGDVSICSVFEEGQEFVIESPWNPPEGFCNWAWADIRTYIHMVNAGGYDTMVACCTDGFRPVFFKIERVES